ncbi:hypothetical protein CA13_38150 [Planctomycetes bacterium CA13]|uniref:Uncharacterized protein n=1 Tax=Novipirellula herctigrandis TaxID=2527986 RepID=A0A5C5Z740_9BACT|nr:hypothetical protein CA13_38150 [Planctomycetes bacterium CA13]
MRHRRLAVPISYVHLVLAAIVMMAWTAGATAQEPAARPQREAKNTPIAKPPLPKVRYWTTQWSFKEMNVAKLAKQLESIGIDTGLTLQGKVTVQFDVGIPMTAIGDGAAYRFDGTLSSPSLIVDGVQLKDLNTSIVYRDGVATLENLNSLVVDRKGMSQPPGQISGRATVLLVPAGDVTADLEVKGISLAPIAALVNKFTQQHDERLLQGGELSGKVKLRVPLSSVDRIETYQLDGNVTGKGLKLSDLPPADFDTGRVQITNGKLLLDAFSMMARRGEETKDSIQILAKASVPLTDKGEFQFELAGDNLPVGTVARMLTQPQATSTNHVAEGKLDLHLTGKGRLRENLQNSTWDLRGAVASPGLAIAGFDLGTLEHNIHLTPTEFNLTPKRKPENLPTTFRLKQFHSNYSITDESLVINGIDASLFDGRLMGSANVPLGSTGDLVVKLNLDKIRRSIALPIASRSTMTLTTVFSGDLDWTVPIDAVDQPVEHQGRAKISLQNITLGSTDIGNLELRVAAQAGEVSLTADGKVFDGTVKVETNAAMQANDHWSNIRRRLTKTMLNFGDVSIGSLLTLATGNRANLMGLASGEVVVSGFNGNVTSMAAIPNADITFELSSVSHRSRLISRALRLRGKLERGIFSIDSFVGDYAGGTARVEGRVYLVDPKSTLRPKADLRLSASRVTLDRGLWFLGDLANDYQGRASVTATVAGYGESIRVRGSVDGRELVFYGLRLGSAHSGIAADADIGHQSWKLRFPSVRSSLGGGQVEGELSLGSPRSGGRGVDFISRWRTRRVDFFRLTTQLGKSNSLAHGEITGDLALRGKSIRSIDDLAGRFDFKLGQTRGAAIPGLIGVSRFLGPASLATQTFDVGAANGMIGGGAVVIDEFWMGSDTALVQADGKIFIRSGRMDLNAMIATGDYRDIVANFAQLAQQYALRSVLPTSAILDISELLRDRTLVVGVTGTMQAPIVRLRPVETFREETARFLLREGQRLILTGVAAEAVTGFNIK